MRVVLFLILLVQLLPGLCQDTLAGKKKAFWNKTVLIVPYNPKLYLNEASKDMVEKSNKPYKFISNFLREEFDKRLHRAMADSCKTIGMLQSYTIETSSDDLDYIYSLTDYFLDDPSEIGKDKKLVQNKSKLATDNENSKKDRKSSTNKRDGELRSEIYNNNNKFLNVKIREKDFFKVFSRKNKVDLFLFINQFEIKGDYSDPYKVQNMSYSREIKVHYSVFNATGDYLFGGISTETLPATENDPERVSGEYFANISKKIVQSIPYQKLFK